MPISCNVDADCDDGEFCNGLETCSEGQCRFLLRNGELNRWTRGELDFWNRGTAAGTVERVRAPAPGIWAVRFTRNAPSGALNINLDLTGLEPDRWYQVTWAWRTSAGSEP